MLAGNLMMVPVVTVPPDMTIREAAALLLRHQVSALPVVAGDSGAGHAPWSELRGEGLERLRAEQP